MWQLLKAEFYYIHRTVLLIAVFIMPFFLLYMQVSTVAIQHVLLPLTAASVISLLMVRSMERRERQHVLLPLSLSQIAWVRLLLILIPSAGFYGAYFLLHLLLKRFYPVWHHDGYDLIMFLGLILLGFSLYLVMHDYFSSKFNRYKSGETDMLVLLVVIVLILLGIPLLLALLWRQPSLDLLRVLCLLAGAVMLYPAVASFCNRRSYLES